MTFCPTLEEAKIGRPTIERKITAALERQRLVFIRGATFVREEEDVVVIVVNGLINFGAGQIEVRLLREVEIEERRRLYC